MRIGEKRAGSGPGHRHGPRAAATALRACVPTRRRPNGLGVLIAATALGGCAYHHPYPEDWAPVATDPALCADIGADYTPFDFHSRRVISWIAGAPEPKPPARQLAADRLRLRVVDHTLTATAYLDGATLAQRQYAIECRGDALTLKLGTHVLAEQGVVGFESTAFDLRKDASGAVVVQLHSSGVGSYGVFPIAGASSTWIGRFVPFRAGAVIPQPPPVRPPLCEYDVSQILVATRQDAEAIEQSLDRGADFEQLASTHNRLIWRWQKGRVGWIPPTLFPAWTPVLATLERGQYSRTPVEDYAGWHILRLNAVRPEGCVAAAAP